MIELENVAIRQGEFHFDKLSLTVEAGQHAVLMGRSGSGKTTILEMICGLRRPTAGRVHIAGKEVTRDPPGQRGIGYVPQDGAIFRAMKVRDQIGFGLSVRRVSSKVIRQRVGELAERLGIEKLLDRQPSALSGGERQRVAIGRALAFDPSVLLLDEPTCALDDETRNEIHELIRNVRKFAQVTILHVSHSSFEAKQLADVIYQMENGRITGC